jgi:hypothetical protein
MTCAINRRVLLGGGIGMLGAAAAGLAAGGAETQAANPSDREMEYDVSWQRLAPVS